MAKYIGVVTGRRILLSNADNVPVELVQNDKDTTVIDFELSKIDYVTDLSQLNVAINYVNVDKDTGESVTDIYTVDKTTVEGDSLKFSWVVGSNASVYAGKCIFQLILTLVDADDVITQQWDSTKQSIEVHSSLENVNVTQPKSFVDFVTQVKNSVSDALAGGIIDDHIQQIAEQYLEEHPVQVTTDNTLSVAGTPADALATGTAIDSLKGDLAGMPNELGYNRTSQVFLQNEAIDSKAISTVDGTGQIKDNTSFWLSNKINVKKGTYMCNVQIYKAVYYKLDGTLNAYVSPALVNKQNEIPSGTAYMILQFHKKTIEFSDKSKVIVSFGSTLPMSADLYSKRKGDYSYYGEKIRLNNSFDLKQIGFSGYGNDVCIYNGMMFCFNRDGNCKVIDMVKGYTVGTPFATADATTLKPHCNTAMFGNKYIETDDYPMVYINRYSSQPYENGVCYVHRFLTTDGEPYGTTLIQTIKIGFANNSIWTNGNDVRPYGNFAVDAVHGFLYAYTILDDEKVTRFFKFKIPSTDASIVTLNESDIVEKFDTDYIPYPQGNTLKNGMLYICSGFGSDEVHGCLNVINLYSHKIVSVIDFNDLAMNIEPEFVDIYCDKMYLGMDNAFELSFY